MEPGRQSIVEFLKLVPNSSAIFFKGSQLQAIKCYFLLPYITIQHSQGTKALGLSPQSRTNTSQDV